MNQNELKFQLARLNLYHTVVKQVLDYSCSDKIFMGVKNVEQIPSSLIEKLSASGYVLHTLDAYSHKGRAIDLFHTNPVTGKAMTGSSSGTAINVFCEINDLGIGTDGGGSVLAPAMALNLFGFISTLIEKEQMERYSKLSTDGISFSPSLGFITRTYDEIRQAIQIVLPLKACNSKFKIYTFEDLEEFSNTEMIKINCPDIYGERQPLLSFLKETLKECDFLISKEGPIDLHGIGDSIFGHFDERCKKIQRMARKGLIRVVNMVNATAIVIPQKEFAVGYVLICESVEEKIAKMLEFSKNLCVERSQLIKSYFGDLEGYYTNGYGSGGKL